MSDIDKVLTIIDSEYNGGKGDIANLDRDFNNDSIADFLHNCVVNEEGTDSISELKSLVSENIDTAIKELNLVRAALFAQPNQ
jgi:hypothetical protein